MPTLSEMFIGGVQDQNKQAGALSDAGWQTGAQLAQLQQQREAQAAQLKQKQQELMNTRVEKLTEDISKADKYKDPNARKNYLKMMKARRDVWGLQDLFSDETMDALLIPEDYGRSVTLAREVQDPQSPFFGKPALAAQAFNDPVKRAEIIPTPAEQWGDKPEESADLNRAFEKYRDRQNALKAAGQRAEGTQGRFEEKLDLGKEDTIRKDVNKISDAYTQTQEQLTEATTHVRSGNTREVSMIISAIARNVGEQKGSLSDGDVKRSIPPDIATNLSELTAYLGKSDAKISAPLQKALLNLIEVGRKKSTAIASQNLARRRKQYSSGSYKNIMQPGGAGAVIFDEAGRMFSGGGDDVRLKKLEAYLKNPAHAQNPDFAERKAEYDKLKAGK